MAMHVRIYMLALEHCWSISTGSCLTILLTAQSNCNLKKCLGSHLFNNNQDMMEGVKTMLSAQKVDLFTSTQKRIPNTTSVSTVK
jgi:hypothetical protein